MVCDNAEPATDFDASLYLPSCKILDAVDAMDLEVCFLFGIFYHLLSNIVIYNRNMLNRVNLKKEVFLMAYVKNIICEKCGAEYKLYKAKLIMRDKDSETCDICGTTLISWNGAVMYSTKLIRKENDTK